MSGANKAAHVYADLTETDGWAARVNRWAGAWLSAQAGLLIYWMPVFMAAGIGLYFGLRFEPPGVAGPVMLLGALGLVAVTWPYRRGDEVRAILCYIAWALCMAGVGFCLAQHRTHAVASPMLGHAIKHARLTGTVESIEWLETGEGLRLMLGELSIEGLLPERTPRHARIKAWGAPGVHPGDRISMLAALNPPSAPVVPRAFDFQFSAWFRQIGAFGFAYRLERIDGAGGHVDAAQRLRQVIGERINRSLQGSRAAMAIAMVTGEVTAVPQADWEAMRDSGLAHMLALSGTHVGLIAGFVFFTVRGALALFPRAALYWPVKKIAAGVAMVMVTAFVWMIGPLLPVLRALVMTDIVLIGVIFDRTAVSMRLLAIATIAVMAVLPEAMLGASFQMSYAAVAVLILFFESTRGWWLERYRQNGVVGRVGLHLLGVLVTTLLAEAATAPFSLFHFQQFSLFGLLANFLAMPLMSFVVMPMVVAVLLAMPLGLEHWPLQAMGWGVERILDVAKSVAALPMATTHLRDWPVAALALIVLAAFCGLGLRGRARWMGVLPAIVALVIIMADRPPDILVASSGKLMALRLPGGIYSMSSKAEKFSAENWMRMAGHQDEAMQYWPHEGVVDGLACDELGCRAERDGRKVAFSFEEAGQAQDCAWADIVVSRIPIHVRPCGAGTVVDLYDLRRDGAAAVWLDGRVETVSGVRGVRPWVVSNER